VDGFTQVYGNDQNKRPKNFKITEEDNLVKPAQTKHYMHEIKETLLLTQIRTAFKVLKS
jgi:hypothetical protein